MKAPNFFLALLLFLASQLLLASGVQSLGPKHAYEHRDKLVAISNEKLFQMGADFCEHNTLSRMPLFYPGNELIIGVFEKEFEENLYHFWSLEEKNAVIPCDLNYQVQYYYISEKFIKHDYDISLERQKIRQARKTSYWHNVFEDQLCDFGFEFIELVVLEISGIRYYYRLDNKNIKTLVSNISMDLFARFIIEPMLASTDIILDVGCQQGTGPLELTLSNNNYKDTLRPGPCMRHCASCLAEFIFDAAGKIYKEKSFAPFEDIRILSSFKEINLDNYNNLERLNIISIQEIINYYLEKLKILLPQEYEKYKNTKIEKLNFG